MSRTPMTSSDRKQTKKKCVTTRGDGGRLNSLLRIRSLTSLGWVPFAVCRSQLNKNEMDRSHQDAWKSPSMRHSILGKSLRGSRREGSAPRSDPLGQPPAKRKSHLQTWGQLSRTPAGACLRPSGFPGVLWPLRERSALCAENSAPEPGVCQGADRM